MPKSGIFGQNYDVSWAFTVKDYTRYFAMGWPQGLDSAMSDA